MTKCVDLEEEEAKTLYEITNKILKNITKEEK